MESARLLLAANNKITIGQFCLREEDGLLYYRAVVIFPAASDAWTKLLSEHLFISVFQIDEFGKFLANVIDKRRAPKHLSEIWDLFTELATSAGTTFLGAEYADQRERPRQDIVEPCACIHGVSAPGVR